MEVEGTAHSDDSDDESEEPEEHEHARAGHTEQTKTAAATIKVDNLDLPGEK